MKEAEIEIPDDYRAEWVNGVLTLVRKNLPKFKFNIGDKVTINSSPFTVFIIEKQLYQNGEAYYELDRRYGYYPPYKESELTLYACGPKVEYKFNVGDEVKLLIPPYGTYKIKGIAEGVPTPHYKLYDEGNKFYQEDVLTIVKPQDITEHIKTFEDACNWCRCNGKKDLLYQHSDIFFMNHTSPDLIAYARLRIITCALNEGWEPTFAEDEERWRVVYDAVDGSYGSGCSLKWETTPNKLIFKSNELAQYAAKQFSDIYADFCGCKKGGKNG